MTYMDDEVTTFDSDPAYEHGLRQAKRWASAETLGSQHEQKELVCINSVILNILKTGRKSTQHQPLTPTAGYDP